MGITTKPSWMRSRSHLTLERLQIRFFMMFALAVVLGRQSLDAEPSRIVQPTPGGVDPRPMLYSLTAEGAFLQASCGGFQGGPFQMVYSTNAAGGQWATLGPVYTNNIFTAQLTNVGGGLFYRVTGPTPSYAGATVGGLACGQCHSSYNDGPAPWDTWYDYWVETPHARAFQALTNQNAAYATNTSCLPCHTVGYGYPGGYTVGNVALQGVQCENCHGPGGVRHRGGDNKRPAVLWSAMVCGGCHDSALYRTYTEWTNSGHSSVEAHVAESYLNPTNGLTSLYRCGSCHSGAMRAYLLIPTGGDMPDGAEAGREGVVCVGCHDPHQNTATGHQLRNPLFSTNTYSVTPPANYAEFSAQYRPGVNLCGQCHNARGAQWTDTSRPPHASPQYNLLLGAIGEMPDGTAPYQPGSHALMIGNQCVGCHMPTSEPSQDHPGISGHTFAVTSFDSCLACHPFPEPLADFTINTISNQVQEAKSWLDTWGVSKAPEPLRTKYGVRAWEFTTPGELSNPPGTTTPGPSSEEQALIPDRIKKARFNIYLVERDGSYGVHNAPFIVYLLETAQNWIRAELEQ